MPELMPKSARSKTARLLALFAACHSSAAIASSLDAKGTASSSNKPRPAKSETTAHLKLISLAPSNTELLYSLGDDGDIEGVCSFCDFPAVAEKKARVGTFVSANLERLSRIKPDLILLVSGQEMLAAKLEHSNFKTRILDNNHLGDIPTNLSILGQLSSREKESKSLANDFKQTMLSLEEAIGKDSKRPSVFYCVWPQPLMTAGADSFINEVITTCGGRNIAGSIKSAYPRYSLEQLILQNPDYIILPFEAHGQKFLSTEPWTKLKAVKEKRVFFLEDQKHDMLSRPTLRIIKGAAWLSSRLHPERQSQIEAWQLSDAYLRCAKKAGL